MPPAPWPSKPPPLPAEAPPSRFLTPQVGVAHFLSGCRQTRANRGRVVPVSLLCCRHRSTGQVHPSACCLWKSAVSRLRLPRIVFVRALGCRSAGAPGKAPFGCTLGVAWPGAPAGLQGWRRRCSEGPRVQAPARATSVLPASGEVRHVAVRLLTVQLPCSRK